MQPIPHSAQQIPLLSVPGVPPSGCARECTRHATCRTHRPHSNCSGFALARLSRLQPVICFFANYENVETHPPRDSHPHLGRSSQGNILWME